MDLKQTVGQLRDNIGNGKLKIKQFLIFIRGFLEKTQFHESGCAVQNFRDIFFICPAFLNQGNILGGELRILLRQTFDLGTDDTDSTVYLTAFWGGDVREFVNESFIQRQGLVEKTL